MNEITKETVKQLYWKYNTDPEDGRDSWDVAADIINELYPRKEWEGRDAGYYYHIHVIFSWLEEYIQSTYLEVYKMNERIRELAEQCRTQTPSTEIAGEFWTHFDEEKFVQLVIKECETALKPMLRDMISRGQAVDIIKKHFSY